MYMWQLVGHDTSEGALCSGIGDDLAPIMRLIEDHLTKRTGFIGHIMEVVPRMSVFHLDAIHVATGREWISLRDRNGGIYWETRYRPADDDGAYHLAGGSDPGSAAN